MRRSLAVGIHEDVLRAEVHKDVPKNAARVDVDKLRERCRFRAYLDPKSYVK